MTTIAGAHAIITGGSEGIGLALARRLHQRGARVSLVARDEQKLATAATRTGAGTLTKAADVRDAAALTSAIEALVEQSGACDILVTAAGYAHPDYFERLPLQVFR